MEIDQGKYSSERDEDFEGDDIESKDQDDQSEGKEINLDNSDENSDENSDKEQYKKIKKAVKNKPEKKKKNIGLVLDTLLKKKRASDADPVLKGNKSTFKKLDEEKQKYLEEREKKKARLEQKKLGYKPIEDWDKKKEKTLLNVTTKGVVKLFNSIYEFRKKIRDEKQREESKKEKKSTNFLMMHDLGTTTDTQEKLNKKKNKKFKEDEE